MLGHHALLERRLRKNGSKAFATVLECKQTNWSETTGNPGIVGNTEILCNLKLQVAPDGEQPFEVPLDWLFGQMSIPSADSKLPVLYDPSDHSKVIIDESPEAMQALVNDSITERTEGIVERMKASGNPASDAAAAGLQKALDAGLMTGYSNDPAELRKQIAERREQIKKIMFDAQTAQGLPATNVFIGGQPVVTGQPAQPAGPAAQPAGPAAQPAGPAAQPAGPAAQPAGPAAQAASTVSTVDALTKLAALHDRGVLTDDEFLAEKKKLLGE
jgi:hypothetical protein